MRSNVTHAPLSVAPMMDWTDRHCRYFHRQMSAHAVLYTEMVTADAVIHGDRERLLGFDPAEHPVVLQLGGSDPAKLAKAARIGAQWGYDAVNLNVGCPSDRVQSGTFGACLMRDADHVARLVGAMKGAVDVQVTVKCRIGVDEQEPSQILPAFIAAQRRAGVDAILIHARKAWLDGLSPKDNRDIPPLDYNLVLRMKSENPDLWMGINGGIRSLDEASALLDRGMDEVMIGRAAYQTPAEILLKADEKLLGATKKGFVATKSPLVPPYGATTRRAVVEAMIPYVDQHLTRGGRLNHISRHMIGLFAGQPGGRRWRQVLSQGAHLPGAGPQLLLDALAETERAAERVAERKAAAA